jgi:hypothetical protein
LYWLKSLPRAYRPSWFPDSICRGQKKPIIFWYLTLSATSRMNSTPVSNSLNTNDAKFWTSGVGRTFMITSVITPRVPEKSKVFPIQCMIYVITVTSYVQLNSFSNMLKQIFLQNKQANVIKANLKNTSARVKNNCCI